ncbi:hypothetical protein [Streptomyces lushanensis]|uniref:hypothetical protein n=1 Tax=Streptomyces lushanensis TaxID=1434255 RepID=UPI00082BFD87|nr:hypothetical protein [Streptomyces lushanensis]
MNPVSFAEPAGDSQCREQAQGQPADPAADAVTERKIADAWHRITCRLQYNAPDSHAALRAGAHRATVAALEHDLGLRIPVGLHALWFLTAGDDGVNGAGCLPGNEAASGEWLPDGRNAHYHCPLRAIEQCRVPRVTCRISRLQGIPQWGNSHSVQPLALDHRCTGQHCCPPRRTQRTGPSV